MFCEYVCKCLNDQECSVQCAFLNCIHCLVLFEMFLNIYVLNCVVNFSVI